MALTFFPFPCALPDLPFYHIVALASFTILQLASISGPVDLNILPFLPASFPFAIYKFPRIGDLVVLVRLVSLFSQVTFVIPAMIPRQVATGCLVGTDILAILVFHADFVSVGLHVVIAIRAILISLICLC